jgi:hypothetical protein
MRFLLVFSIRKNISCVKKRSREEEDSSMIPIRKFKVRPSLPLSLSPLLEIAQSALELESRRHRTLSPA